jgi:hypothetical protein
MGAAAADCLGQGKTMSGGGAAVVFGTSLVLYLSSQ